MKKNIVALKIKFYGSIKRRCVLLVDHSLLLSVLERKRYFWGGQILDCWLANPDLKREVIGNHESMALVSDVLACSISSLIRLLSFTQMFRNASLNACGKSIQVLKRNSVSLCSVLSLRFVWRFMLPSLGDEPLLILVQALSYQCRSFFLSNRLWTEWRQATDYRLLWYVCLFGWSLYFFVC